jgi:tetratricopeptide (TPR) repeat protein
MNENFVLCSHFLTEAALEYFELGRCLYNQRKYEDAQVAFSTTLDIETNTVGRDHPNTAWSKLTCCQCHSIDILYLLSLSALSYLSDCYQASRNYEKALCLLQETLKIRKNKYGDNHEKTLSTLRRMGELYNKWGKYEKAEECLREALGIAEAASLTGHVEVAYGELTVICNEWKFCSLLSFSKLSNMPCS